MKMRAGCCYVALKNNVDVKGALTKYGLMPERKKEVNESMP